MPFRLATTALVAATLLPAAPAAAAPRCPVSVTHDGRIALAGPDLRLSGLRAELSGTTLTRASVRRGSCTVKLSDRGRSATLTASTTAGSVRLTLRAPASTRATLRVPSARGERFLGFGERSDAVVRTGGNVQNRVTEGPYVKGDLPLVNAVVPKAGQSTRADATYFPIPWLLSTRGYGALVEGDDPTTLFALRAGRDWAVTSGAPLSVRFFGGPTPAAALRRFTAAVGRQPAPSAPFVLGPWWQPPKGSNIVQDAAALRAAGAAGSLVQTYTHYLPCADENHERERAQTAAMHAQGLAITTYFNPMLCQSHPRWPEAVGRGALTRNRAGGPYTYTYAGSTIFAVGQFDFTARAGRSLYEQMLGESVADGYDGWMEDFGEYTPDDAVSADGTPGRLMHNRYPVLYHRTARTAELAAGRPLARFARSGWTGSARYTPIVWGGDPTTVWGFDGLRSAVRNGLSMGLSGVSTWGSDIGGFFAISTPQTTPELLARWIEFGFASGVMRLQANGFDLGRSGRRAQVLDPDVLPVWRRYARLRTQLYPYLAAAAREYTRTGMPIMRQLALAYPRDARAAALDDEYMLGPDLLVAPVMKPGARTRRVYLPAGRWVDFWRSVRLGPGEAPAATAPKILKGGRWVTVPAPLDQLPLFVRAGARLTLLPGDVDTLAAYGAGSGVVRLADRPARRTLRWR